ncbi:MAG: UDP-2,3-diacylglucosamine diphosphatase [Bdellovibrionales bacterium]
MDAQTPHKTLYASAPTTPRNYYRSVFLSDFHIGAKNFDAAALTKFLDGMQCRYLFLVGDIIDGWKLNKRWYWTQDCTNVLDALVQKRIEGTKIIYLPGNHDDEVRKFMPVTRHEFARRLGIRIKNKTIHTMLDGRRLLVLHGDQFDRKIIRGPLSKWSDQFYEWLIGKTRNHKRAHIRINGQIKPFSLAKALSKHGGWALCLINNFENTAHKTIKQQGLDGLICGHTHIPVVKNIKDIIYGNPGSWVGTGLTALIETVEGELKLLDHQATQDTQPCLFNLDSQDFAVTRPNRREHPVTRFLIRTIREIWPEKTQSKTATNTPWLDACEDTISTLEKRALNLAHSIRLPKRPTNLATKIVLRPDLQNS